MTSDIFMFEGNAHWMLLKGKKTCVGKESILTYFPQLNSYIFSFFFQWMNWNLCSTILCYKIYLCRFFLSSVIILYLSVHCYLLSVLTFTVWLHLFLSVFVSLSELISLYLFREIKKKVILKDCWSNSNYEKSFWRPVYKV